MTFQQYKARAREILASPRGEGLLRLDCMNPVKALEAMRPAPPPRPGRVAAAEVAAAWRERFGVDAAAGRVALSTGVRPLLARLFDRFAREGRRLLAPQDVYPVYLELAVAAGLPAATFPTVPAPSLPSLPSPEPAPGPSASAPEVLLLAEPLVPLGRGLDADETARLSAWLAADARRLLVLDCVYTFDDRFSAAAARLLGGGRTVLLHSLAKSFLSPGLAGFAVGPPEWLDDLQEDLEDEIDGDGLASAAHVLRQAAGLPRRLGDVFSRRWSRLPRELGPGAPAGGYFGVLPLAFDELLARGVLAVPGSVFGARTGGWSAITCLLLDGGA